MGSLRLVFAIAVVLGHAGIDASVGGRNAVQLFYLISGFLISYVLVERRSYADIGSFYLNRFLRLYPLYCVVAIVTLVLVAVGLNQQVVSTFENAPWSARFLLVASNLFLFGQDWVMFAGVQGHELVFATDFHVSDVSLWRGLLVPPAWSLGVELTFYAVAPFLLSSRRRLVLALAVSVLVRVFTWVIGIGDSDPWTYRFFPSELALFLTGAVAHQVLLPAYMRWTVGRYALVPQAAVLILLSVSLLYSLVPASSGAKTAVLLPLFVVLMPFAFLFQQRSRLDGRIGELSYPVYIVHFLVIELLRPTLATVGVRDSGTTMAIAASILSIVLAILLNALVSAPIERLRTNIRSRKKDEPSRVQGQANGIKASEPKGHPSIDSETPANV
jgi:peptidoglycan/LPS O-acetylase OafA/YrhL